VTLATPDAVTVEYLDGPFRYLKNEWKFRPSADGKGTEVDFFLEFEFRSKLLQSLIGMLFEEAVHRMVAAFETRARALYASAG
jgi:coenzyme Q-binding protein COQ10